MSRKLGVLVAVMSGLLASPLPAAAQPFPAAESPAPPAPVVTRDGPDPAAGSRANGGDSSLDALLREAEDGVRALRRATEGGGGTDEARRAELAASRERIAALEAGRAVDAATIARLRAEVDALGAEARRLIRELESSWEWIEELNAVLASLGAGSVLADGAPDGGYLAETPAARPAAPEPPARTRLPGPLPLPGVLASRTDAAAPPAGGDRSEAAPAAPTAGAYYTVERAVNLRAAPRNTAEVLAIMQRGAVVRRMERERGWLRVAYTGRSAREVVGWVYEDFLQRVDDPA